jgi:hypothetical protein
LFKVHFWPNNLHVVELPDETDNIGVFVAGVDENGGQVDFHYAADEVHQYGAILATGERDDGVFDLVAKLFDGADGVVNLLI